MAEVFQAIGAATALSSTNVFNSKRVPFSYCRSVSDRKTSVCTLRSDGSLFSGSSSRGRKAEPLTAVATKAESSTASAASKPGHELLLYEGQEEEMEKDPTVCAIGEDVGHYYRGHTR